MPPVSSRVALAFVVAIGGLACVTPPARGPDAIEARETAGPGRAPASRHPTHSPARPLPEAIEIAGLPPAPLDWPEPVPTIWDDGALSIRALRLDANPLLASAQDGAVVRLWAFIQGNEPREGEPIRTWLVDRSIDLARLDQGIPVEPALPTLASGARIQLIARLERRELAGIAEPMLVLTPIAWALEGADTWQTLAGEPSDPSTWPPETEPSPLLRGANLDRPEPLVDDLDHALDAIARASLADDGALAERHARRALQLDDRNVEFWSTLIALYYGYGHHDHLLAALQAASARGLVELDDLWLAYGSLDVELGEFRAAIALLEQALIRAPDSLVVNFYLATAHWLLGELAAAEPGYAKVVALAGGSHDAVEQRMIATATARLAELERGRE